MSTAFFEGFFDVMRVALQGCSRFFAWPSLRFCTARFLQSHGTHIPVFDACRHARAFRCDGDAAYSEHPNSGVITCLDPRRGHLPVPGLDIANGNFAVNAKAGQLLVFPGWLTLMGTSTGGKAHR